MATLTKSTGTVTLSGAVEKVTLPAVYGWVWVKNMSDGDMFVGLSEGISAGADGVMRIPAGDAGRIQTDGQDSVYLMGTGNALVVAQNYADCPFKVGGKGGEIPDLSAYAKTVDVPNIKVNSAVDADTVNGHSVNADVPENAVFTDTVPDLSPYAKKTDIPTELPANGGNADTVNGHTVDADVPADAVFTDTVPDLSPYALKSKYGDTTINVGRKADTTVGDYSTAEGYETTASGQYSHAEGAGTTASNNCSHAEGSNTTASGTHSHAEGLSTTATNYASHACGHRNADMTTGGMSNNTTGTAFVIGNGTSSTALSNAFSVMFNGTVKAKSTITASTTADYAEFFEWLDGNPDSEDRVGYFVTMDGDKIRIANSDDDYILGVVSGEPFVLGNGDCDTWNGMFLRDEFRRTIYEPAPKMEEILDDNGNPTGEYLEIEGAFEGTRPKLNPEYDHTQTYISRFDRPEWSPVGMLGVLAVRHDGTAKVNGYVTVADGGIATACDKNAENSYRVIKANSDSVVEVIFR